MDGCGGASGGTKRGLKRRQRRTKGRCRYWLHLCHRYHRCHRCHRGVCPPCSFSRPPALSKGGGASGSNVSFLCRHLALFLPPLRPRRLSLGSLGGVIDETPPSRPPRPVYWYCEKTHDSREAAARRRQSESAHRSGTRQTTCARSVQIPLLSTVRPRGEGPLEATPHRHYDR